MSLLLVPGSQAGMTGIESYYNLKSKDYKLEPEHD